MNSLTHLRWTPGTKIESPLRLYHCRVADDWIDYNGHLTESRYLWAFGEATDALFRYVGIDDDYRAAGHSFYTVETHINYYKEVVGGEPLHFTTQLLGLDEKRLHLFHTMFHGLTQNLLCTTEQMLVHVARHESVSAAAPILPEVYAALQAVLTEHQALPIPKQVGRQMTIKKNLVTTQSS